MGRRAGRHLPDAFKSEHLIQNTIIKNATTGIRLDSAAVLKANNTIITHSSRVNLYGGYGNAALNNCISGPAGVYGLCALGGQYTAKNSTFLNTWSYSTRGGTAVGLSNYFEDGTGTRYTRDLQALFFESIIDGSLDNEVGMAIDPGAAFDVRFGKVRCVSSLIPRVAITTLAIPLCSSVMTYNSMDFGPMYQARCLPTPDIPTYRIVPAH